MKILALIFLTFGLVFRFPIRLQWTFSGKQVIGQPIFCGVNGEVAECPPGFRMELTKYTEFTFRQHCRCPGGRNMNYTRLGHKEGTLIRC